MLLRARIVLPISRPPIIDGVIRIENGCIAEVGEWRDLHGDTDDLGDVILMPGFVNAHCHLDYTSLAGCISAPETFNEWIGDIMWHKNVMSDDAWRESWLKGASQCLKRGITTVGNIETRLELLEDIWAETHLRLSSYLELITVKSESDSDNAVQKVVNFLKSHKPRRGDVGISPHAPYTVNPDALRRCAEISQKDGLRMTMHIAESADESTMFLKARGSLYQRLLDVGRDMSDCGRHSPVEQASRCGVLSDRLLVVHGNYLDDADIHRLAESNTSIAHCPRSHDYFGHTPFRFQELKAAGVNICLGTDSLATVNNSNAELDLIEEMRLFQKNYPASNSEQIVSMATVNGAKALNWAGKVGEISVGAFADLIAVPYSGLVDDVYDAVIEQSGPDSVMIDGQWELR